MLEVPLHKKTFYTICIRYPFLKNKIVSFLAVFSSIVGILLSVILVIVRTLSSYFHGHIILLLKPWANENNMVEMQIPSISHFFLKYDFVVLLFQKMKLIIFHQHLLE